MKAFHSNIPEIITRGSLALQHAVSDASEEIEFHILQAAQQRQRTGAEVRGTKYKAGRDPFTGFVNAGQFYTRFSEYGTVNQSARPIVGPAAERAWPGFLKDAEEAYRFHGHGHG